VTRCQADTVSLRTAATTAVWEPRRALICSRNARNGPALGWPTRRLDQHPAHQRPAALADPTVQDAKFPDSRIFGFYPI
jgi:hypothetical protein